MDLTVARCALGVLSGVFVGFSLGLVGGGGSVLAVPLIGYPGLRSNPPDVPAKYSGPARDRRGDRYP